MAAAAHSAKLSTSSQALSITRHVVEVLARMSHIVPLFLESHSRSRPPLSTLHPRNGANFTISSSVNNLLFALHPCPNNTYQGSLYNHSSSIPNTFNLQINSDFVNLVYPLSDSLQVILDATGA
ncbi:MAG: hypothetical protein LQ340_000844 [Diploschistes diacapsis]|nr:MAG: hypothetical protein LQ340_000844 [Diploschistes diacapsis]